MLALLTLALVPAVARAAPPPGIVTDALTGVALDGNDAVSYFTTSGPVEGVPDYEYDWAGVPWYFANAANRDVFMRAPATYAPQFGGHAAAALAQGFLSDGNPAIYAVIADRLYLFYSLPSRTVFLGDAAKSIAAARAQWQKLGGTPGP